MWPKNPNAIWLRPALCTHRNNTVGLPSWAWPSTLARACRRCRANRSASSGKKVRDRTAGGELVVAGVQEPLDGFRAERAVELAAQVRRGGT